MPSSACYSALRDLHSFPTRRSSDLIGGYSLERVLDQVQLNRIEARLARLWPPGPYTLGIAAARVTEAMLESSRATFAVLTMLGGELDRKSTRLNSSHGYISYAVFCLLLRPPRPTLFPYTTLFRSHRRLLARARA